MKGPVRLVGSRGRLSPSRAESASTVLTVGAQTLQGTPGSPTPREGWRAGTPLAFHTVRAVLAGGIGTVH